jgi:hypothetical protein
MPRTDVCEEAWWTTPAEVAPVERLAGGRFLFMPFVPADETLTMALTSELSVRVLGPDRDNVPGTTAPPDAGGRREAFGSVRVGSDARSDKPISTHQRSSAHPR